MSSRPRIARRVDGVSLSLTRQVFERAPAGAINLGLGEPVFATAPKIVDAARSRLEAGNLGYTFNGGVRELRELIARRAPGDRGPDSVCVTVGANGALFGAILATVDVGDEVLVPDPGFPSYEAIATLAGAHAVPYGMHAVDGFRFSVALLEPLLNDKTRAIVINNPSNPTGRIIGVSELAELAELADSRDLTVISDEVYRDFYFGERCPSYLEVSSDGLVVNSLSKTEAMTGWRIGWVIGPPHCIAAITAINQSSVTCAPALSQAAAMAALDEGAAERAAAMRHDFDRRRRLMIDAIDERLGLPRLDPDGSFFVMLEAAPAGNSLEVALDILEQTSVITVPGSAFGKNAARWLRLSFAASEAQIVDGIGRIADYF